MSAMSMKRLRFAFRLGVAALLCSGTAGLTATVALAQDGGPIVLELSSSSGVAEDTVEVGISLHTNGHSVAGIQVEIAANPPLAIARSATDRPDCWRNTEINKDYTAYAFPFRLSGDWTKMRALVLSLANVDPIPDGSLLFTCRVNIDADATPGEYQLVTSRMLGSTPQGEEIPEESSGGTIVIGDGAGDSVPLVEGMGQSSAGGCAIREARPSAASALLLVLPLLLWALRRVRVGGPLVGPARINVDRA